MGNIFQQSRLRLHQPFDPVRHTVEIAHQLGQFVVPAAGGRACARAQVSCCQALSSPSQTCYRTRHGPGQQVADQSGRNNCNRDSEQREVMASEEDSRSRRQLQNQGIAFSIQCQRFPHNAVGQKTIHPGSMVERGIARWNTPSDIFDPGWNHATSEFVAGGIEDERAHMLSVPKRFQIVVSGMLTAALICIHSFSQGLQTLTCNAAARRLQGDRH